MKFLVRYFIFFPFIYFYFFTFSLQAEAKFIKQTSFPVLNTGVSTDWDSSQVYGPTILYENDKYRMWFSGNDNNKRQIGYAESSIPTSFTKKESNPLLQWNIINSDDIGVEHPYVLKLDTYKMWFSNVERNLYGFKLFFSSSLDGIDWNNYIPLTFNLNSTTWDSSGMGAPSVIYDSEHNLYHLWYVARGEYEDSSHWRIGYANSTNGLNWIKHPNPVIKVSQPSWEGIDVSNPCVVFENGIFYMFYHGDYGIGMATSTDGIHWTKDPANPILTPTVGTFDSKRVFNPYVLKKDGIYYMWYTGVDDSGKWQIGLATSDEIPVIPAPTSTPTPTPTSTLTPTVSPTATTTPSTTPTLTPTPTPIPQIPQQFSPIIIIPGLGASWNPQDIFSCSVESSGNWEMAPYVSVYNRLIKTLTENSGLQLNQDVYLYAYDWRQPLDKQAEKFKKFIDDIYSTKPANTKFRLVGHSLGGLIIRSYLANNPNSHHIEAALTVGTPHMGTVLAYPIWEKAEFATDDLVLQIAIGQLINHCRVVNRFVPPKKYVPIKKFKSNREIVQYFVPVVKQLLPTFNFLKQNGSIKDSSTLTNKNDWLINNPIPSDKYQISLSTLSGDNLSTWRYLNVVDSPIREKAFGDWVDGKPTTNETSNSGDGTILTLSSQIDGANNEKIAGSHNDIISSTTGIFKILDFLGLTNLPIAQETAVVEEISTSALTISGDDGTIVKITDPTGKAEQSKQNILVTYNPPAGLYQLEIVSNKTAEVELSVAQIKKDTQAISENIAISQTKNRPNKYYLIYNPKSETPIKLIPIK